MSYRPKFLLSLFPVGFWLFLLEAVAGQLLVSGSAKESMQESRARAGLLKGPPPRGPEDRGSAGECPRFRPETSKRLALERAKSLTSQAIFSSDEERPKHGKIIFISAERD